MKFFDFIASHQSRQKIEMSSFDMSFEHKTTLPFGKLCPVFLQEVLPGDKWHITPSSFLRSMPLLSPMMHKLDLKLRFFFVPNRLVWDKWERFISTGLDSDNRSIEVPTFSIGSSSDSDDVLQVFQRSGSLLDYFGFSTVKYPHDFTFSQLPFRAYDLIVREYFKNKLVDPSAVFYDGGSASLYSAFNGEFAVGKSTVSKLKDFNLLLTADAPWNNDYFTSCSPTPLGVSSYATARSESSDTASTATPPLNPDRELTLGNKEPAFENTVSSLRKALRLQNFLETTLRFGRRYVEQLFGHFGVVSSDARLQRPEYLGGGSLAVQVSEVASTADSSSGHLGDLAGRGLSVGSFPDINFTSEEHGFIIGIAYVVPKSSYFGGLNRSFLRTDRLDFAFPEFADLSEQPVYTSELDAGIAQDENEDATKIFGYVPRYSDYKQSRDIFSGEMSRSLSFWHLGRSFLGTKPVLNNSFIYIDDSTRKSLNRVFGVTDSSGHPFVATFGFNAIALRPLPYNPFTVF